ncbi:hypothetical protein [Nonomuraea sp. NPDC052265]|uniref:hypothetical protein n=1 Tax=Nonomuraea sp. NPDC052265 TaxID=3364374 RepID=UPI0037CBBDFB
MGGRYWLLLGAFLASSLGTWIHRPALPLLVYDLTGSALGTGLVYVTETCRTCCWGCSAG